MDETIERLGSASRSKFPIALLGRLLRPFIRLRFRAAPVSHREASWWAERLPRYPSIFSGFGYDLSTVVPVSDGIRMRLFLRDRLPQELLAGRRWDPIIERTLRAVLADGAVFFDIGANIGYFTLLASRVVGPTGRVVAFEPNPATLLQLIENLTLNDTRNVALCNVALADAHGFVDIHVSSGDNTGETSIRAIPRSSTSVPVLQCPLDSLFETLPRPPAAIKIDVEGAEMLVLRGMKRTLASTSPIVICEILDSFLRELGASADMVVDYMRSLGYAPYYEEPVEAAGVTRYRWSTTPSRIFSEHRDGFLTGGHMLFAKDALPPTLTLL